MKRFIGFIIAVFTLTLAFTFMAPQTSFAGLGSKIEDSGSYHPSRRPPNIDYAIGVVITLYKDGHIASSGIYVSLLKRFGNARALAADGKLRASRNMLNAAGRFIDAQSGLQDFGDAESGEKALWLPARAEPRGPPPRPRAT